MSRIAMIVSDIEYLRADPDPNKDVLSALIKAEASANLRALDILVDEIHALTAAVKAFDQNNKRI